MFEYHFCDSHFLLQHLIWIHWFTSGGVASLHYSMGTLHLHMMFNIFSFLFFCFHCILWIYIILILSVNNIYYFQDFLFLIFFPPFIFFLFKSDKLRCLVQSVLLLYVNFSNFFLFCWDFLSNKFYFGAFFRLKSTSWWHADLLVAKAWWFWLYFIVFPLTWEIG